MFQKLVAIEPVILVLSAEKALYSFSDEVVMYSDIPAGDNEIIARIGDADAVLVLRQVVGYVQLEGEKLEAADYDDDGNINAGDAVLILRKTVGLI